MKHRKRFIDYERTGWTASDRLYEMERLENLGYDAPPDHLDFEDLKFLQPCEPPWETQAASSSSPPFSPRKKHDKQTYNVTIKSYTDKAREFEGSVGCSQLLRMLGVYDPA